MRGLVVLALAIPLAAQTDEGGAIFRKHIAPMIQTKCVSCHGEQQRISGFSIGSRAALLKGGNRGAALIPGYAKDSLLLAVLDHSHIVKSL